MLIFEWLPKSLSVQGKDFRQDALVPQSLIVGLGDFETQILVHNRFSGVMRIGRDSKGLDFGSPSNLNQVSGDVFAGIHIVIVDPKLPVVARTMVVAFVVSTFVGVFRNSILDLCRKYIKSVDRCDRSLYWLERSKMIVRRVSGVFPRRRMEWR